MRIIKSKEQITPYGGLTFVFQYLEHKKIGRLINTFLPDLPRQCRYSWKDLIYSLWSIPFCGGDCIEDLSINLKKNMAAIPYFNAPSPDSVLKRLKELSKPNLNNS